MNQYKTTNTFQLTRPRKARRGGGGVVQFPKNFNSRAHARRDQRGNTLYPGVSKFQLTRPRKARQRLLCRLGILKHFNSRAHARRDLKAVQERIQECTFQLTRPRKARRSRAKASRGWHKISTHAPTQGATASNLQCASLTTISTHAPTQGATFNNVIMFLDNGYFNSRAHARRDRNILI